MSVEDESAAQVEQPSQSSRIESWFRRYSMELRRFILRNSVNPNETDDLLHDAFVVALQKMSSYQEVGHARAYLYRITRNLILARRRTQRSSEKSGLSQSEIDAITAVPENKGPQMNSQLKNHLARLGPVERLVIQLRIEESMPFKKIAETLECPLNTAISCFHRAIMKLRTACGRDNHSQV